MTVYLQQDCPACKGARRIYDQSLIGGHGSVCGVCAGAGVVTRERAEEWLDMQSVTRGEVRRMINNAIRASKMPPKQYRPKPSRRRSK